MCNAYYINRYSCLFNDALSTYNQLYLDVVAFVYYQNIILLWACMDASSNSANCERFPGLCVGNSWPVFDVKENWGRINAWKFGINLNDSLKFSLYLTENTLHPSTKTKRFAILTEITALSAHHLCEMQSLLNVATAVS